tara:strand:+ start:717 stop:1577 length:861 start_codon:yes stop_codon:yes gene_type:complete
MYVIVLIILVICGILAAILLPFLEKKNLPQKFSEYKNNVTVIIPTYNRDKNYVTRILHEYLDMDIVKDVFLVEFETGNQIRKSPSPKKEKTWRTYTYENDLRHRFNPVVDVKTESVLITDDDVIVSESVLNNLCFKVDYYPDYFHGIEGRKFKYDERTNMYSYDSKPIFAKHDMDGEIVDMVLTSCLMAKTELLQEVYRRFTNTFFKDAMKFNGEDIVINMINGKSMAWNWEKYFIFKTQIPFLTFNKKKMVSGSVNHEISKKPDHVKERSHVVNTTRNHLLELAK